MDSRRTYPYCSRRISLKMEVFRLSKAQYANDLSGTGAKLAGGRWNKKGSAVVYTSGSRALATLEVLVHIPAFYVPSEYILSIIWIPDGEIKSLDQKLLPEDWSSLTPPMVLQELTNEWLQRQSSLGLKVPSAIVKDEYNFLLNPLHPKMEKIKVVSQEPYRFDPRLL